jgi:hypothetical protein
VRIVQRRGSTPSGPKRGRRVGTPTALDAPSRCDRHRTRRHALKAGQMRCVRRPLERTRKLLTRRPYGGLWCGSPASSRRYSNRRSRRPTSHETFGTSS